MSFLLKTLVYLSLCLPAFAKVVTQPYANFLIDTDRLLAGDIHAYVDVVEASELKEKYPNFFEFDAFKLHQNENVRLVISKSAYVVNHPVGFFSDRQLMDEKWLEHVRPGQDFSTKGDYTLQARSKSGRYTLDVYYDSDDISNVQKRPLLHAVSLSKRIDPLAGSSFATSCLMTSQSSSARQGELTISNYISLNTKQTVVISYQVTALAKWKNKGLNDKVKTDYLKGLPRLVKRINSFKAN